MTKAMRKTKTPLERVYIPMEWRDKHEIEWPVIDNNTEGTYILWCKSIEDGLLSDIPIEFSNLNIDIGIQRVNFVLNHRYKNAKSIKGNIKDTYLWDTYIKRIAHIEAEFIRQNCPKAFISSVVFCCYP